MFGLAQAALNWVFGISFGTVYQDIRTFEGRPAGTFVEAVWYGVFCMYYLLFFKPILSVASSRARPKKTTNCPGTHHCAQAASWGFKGEGQASRITSNSDGSGRSAQASNRSDTILTRAGSAACREGGARPTTVQARA